MPRCVGEGRPEEQEAERLGGEERGRDEEGRAQRGNLRSRLQ